MRKLLYILLFLGILCSCSNQKHETSPEIWMWVHWNGEHTQADWDKAFKKMADAGIEGVLMGGGKEALQTIIPLADQYSIQVHAWFWTMNRGDAKEEWLSVNRQGKSLAEQKAYVDYYKFMCPALPEVKSFIRDHILELSQVGGLKGIHMDYIRYVDVILPEAIQPQYNLVQDHEFPEYDYGYHPYMRKLYMERYGKDPIKMESPEDQTEWREFRYDQLTETVKGIRKVTDSCGLKLSAAVFPTPDIARNLVRQDWEQWPLDYFFPMIYHNFYNKDIEWISEATAVSTNATGDEQLLFTGLYIPAFKEPGELGKAIEAAYKGGASGVSLFDYRAMKDFHWEELKGVTSTD